MNSEVKGLKTDQASVHLGTYGIIKTFFEKYGIVDFVDTLLPKTKDHKVSNGQCFLCLCLIGFSFIRRALYSIAKLFESIPIPIFFGRDIEPEAFNDDVLGRFLDKINEYGSSAFFVRLLSHIHSITPDIFDFDIFHGDITNFPVYGKYKSCKDDDNFRITWGHSKDGRSKLKLFSLLLVCNPIGIPIYMKELSGNCSDQKELGKCFNDVREALIKNLNIDIDEALYIADAAFYCEKNIKNFIGKFVTRVPETIKEAKNLVSGNFEMTTLESDDRYSYYVTHSNYADVKQQFVLFHSTAMDSKKTATFNKNLIKELATVKTQFRKLSRNGFACEADATQAAEKYISEQELFKFSSCTIVAKNVSSKKIGRPKKDDKKTTLYYINGEIALDEDAVAKKRLTLGRFVLATNDLSLSPERILQLYKEQNQVEKDFRFLKSNEFHNSDVLLKKPSRIQGLCCLMAFVVLMHSILQLEINKGLKDNDLKYKNCANKLVSEVTLTECFKKIELFTGMINYDELRNQIRFSFVPDTGFGENESVLLKALGQEYIKFYAYDTGYVPLTDLPWALKLLKKVEKLKVPL
ncbi:MAG: IS1634 family transposase [Endomicrobium sp.]|jgi:transposase|nr:IS1634 family transposase [Endomicrobium sp.]